MPKLKNISNSVYRLQDEYVWRPGETLEVTAAIAEHVLAAQAGRFEVVPDEPEGESAVTGTPDRQQKKGRTRFRG